MAHVSADRDDMSSTTAWRGRPAKVMLTVTSMGLKGQILPKGLVVLGGRLAGLVVAVPPVGPLARLMLTEGPWNRIMMGWPGGLEGSM